MYRIWICHQWTSHFFPCPWKTFVDIIVFFYLIAIVCMSSCTWEKIFASTVAFPYFLGTLHSHTSPSKHTSPGNSSTSTKAKCCLTHSPNPVYGYKTLYTRLNWWSTYFSGKCSVHALCSNRISVSAASTYSKYHILPTEPNHLT